ncbi:MAG: hypothetical protein CMB41_04405 [Euryarchaeota archaeon]|nr:hypothetical protein [Euryarchaeota archaeon]|tara:strand:- start:9335 stop:10597 length:1263 start_codon:yes stop_codon:yes gene_type:complete
MTKTLRALALTLTLLLASLAGCVAEDETNDETPVDEKPAFLDASDAGYTYASDVDNHRSLMLDLCDIKTAASESDWDTATQIYMNGKNAQKDDGSYRTLAGFAAASGKNHNYDAYYGVDGAIGGHIMQALNGDGDFAGTSDTVRYQGIAKLTANMGMVGYTIHELNAAVAKADAGNIDDDTGAPHNWDEGWAFFHGPDEHYGCSPAKVMEKRAADFGTADADGVAATFKAAEQAMVDGLAALQAGDEAGYDAATETVIKNIIITYSQATLKYTSKMDSTDSAEKYQAEGYAFWKTIEAYAAPYTDGCYNMAVHKVFMMGDIDASACDAFIWTNGSMDSTGTNDTCYNTVTHQVSTDVSNETECDGYAAMYFQDKYGAEKINEIVNLQDATKLGTSYDVAPHLAQVWAHYGITAADIGSMS